MLLKNKTLLILAAALACFHLGNGAMLPLYGLAVVSTKQVDPSQFVATTIVVAQGVMMLVSLIATRVGEKQRLLAAAADCVHRTADPRRDRRLCHQPRGACIPFRSWTASAPACRAWLSPALVARILHGSGRVNVGQGAVMTVQGLGAALSPLIGGWIAQEIGYGATFMILGSFAFGSIALWLGFASTLKAGLRAAGPFDGQHRPATLLAAAE